MAGSSMLQTSGQTPSVWADMENNKHNGDIHCMKTHEHDLSSRFVSPDTAEGDPDGYMQCLLSEKVEIFGFCEAHITRGLSMGEYLWVDCKSLVQASVTCHQ